MQINIQEKEKMLVPGFNLERYDSGMVLAPTRATLERPWAAFVKVASEKSEGSGIAGASVSSLAYCIKARKCLL